MAATAENSCLSEVQVVIQGKDFFSTFKGPVRVDLVRPVAIMIYTYFKLHAVNRKYTSKHLAKFFITVCIKRKNME